MQGGSNFFALSPSHLFSHPLSVFVKRKTSENKCTPAQATFLSLSLSHTHTHTHIHKPRQGQVLWVVSKYCWCQCCPHACIVLHHVESADSYDLSFVSLSPSLDFFLCLSPSLPPSLATLSPSRVLLRSISSTLSYSKALFLSPCPLPSLSPLWHSLCTRSLTEGASGSSTRC